VAERAIPALKGQPDEQAVRLALERVLGSDVFVHSERLSRFLRYAVEQYFLGHGEQLKESVIAVEVYGRPPGYNPKTDPIVRNEARRLRAKLQEYYQVQGRNDPISIGIPKGCYAPVFQQRRPSGLRLSLGSHRIWKVGAIAVAVSLLAAFVGYRLSRPAG
jgi:hypothetical protein